MKRRMVAAVTMALAVAGQSWAQERNAPMPIRPDMPGRATVSNSIVGEQKPVEGGDKKVETVAPPVTNAPTSPVADACQPNCNGTKPSLLDNHTGPPYQLWLSASYLSWRISDMPLPQTLGQINGQTFAGNQDIDFGNFNGLRINGGMWFGCQHVNGLEFNGFWLQQKTQTDARSGDGIVGVFVTRPIIDALPNEVFNVLVSAPGGLAGTLTSTASSQLGSWEVNFVRNLWYECGCSFDALIGAKYIDLEEDLTLVQNSQALAGAPFVLNNSAPIYNQLNITDQFHTRNQMWGAQIGGRFEIRRGIYFGTLTGKVALGPNHQTTDLLGQTVATTPAGQRDTGVGGLLVQPGGEVVPNSGGQVQQYSNGGTRKTDWFAVSPEVGVQVGAQLTQSLRCHIGYNFLYINNVVRPGDLIDTTINRKYVPFSDQYRSNSGPDRPQALFGRDDFIAHGVEVGLQFQF